VVALNAAFAEWEFREDITATLRILRESSPLVGEPFPGFLSLDVILPYLFSAIPLRHKSNISLLLGAYRTLVSAYLTGRDDVDRLRAILRAGGIDPIEAAHYRDLNLFQRAALKQNLYLSYLASTRRVFYRRAVLCQNAEVIEGNLLTEVLGAVDCLSAFFLFDDDVVDLEKDLVSGKDTLLSNYLLSQGGTLRMAVKEMLAHLENRLGKHEHDIYLTRFGRTICDLYLRSLDAQP